MDVRIGLGSCRIELQSSFASNRSGRITSCLRYRSHSCNICNIPACQKQRTEAAHEPLRPRLVPRHDIRPSPGLRTALKSRMF